MNLDSVISIFERVLCPWLAPMSVVRIFVQCDGCGMGLDPEILNDAFGQGGRPSPFSGSRKPSAASFLRRVVKSRKGNKRSSREMTESMLPCGSSRWTLVLEEPPVWKDGMGLRRR